MVELNRNVSQIYEINGKKIVSKYHQKPIFFRRELFFYNLFQKNPMVKIPKIYSSYGLNLQTYFIETEEKDIFKTAIEWAKIHSHFIDNPIKDNSLFVHHNIQEVRSYVFKNINLFWEIKSVVKNKLLNAKTNQNLITLLHGDLQSKNMVTFKGDNYYFDFELGGLGHPGRDVASIIISNPEKKNELIDVYRKNIGFDYSKIKEDIDIWLTARTAQLYVLFSKRKGNLEQKEDIKNKLVKIIKEI